MEFNYENKRILFNDLNEFLNEQKKLGKKIIGFSAHEFIPVELINSLGILTIPFIFAGNEERTSIGGGFLTPTMCPFALSNLGLFEELHQNEPNLDFSFLKLIDGVISTNYCVADILVNEYISDKYNLKLFNLYVPYLQREPHKTFLKSELKRLLIELSEFAKKKLDIKEFIKNYEKSLQIRKIIHKLINSKVSFGEKLRIIQTCALFGINLIDTTELDTYVENCINHINYTDEDNNNKKKVILMGSSLFIGDSLIDIIEQTNAEIVIDTSWLNIPFIKLDDYDNTRKILAELTQETLSEDEKIDKILNIYLDQFSSRGYSLHIVSDIEPFKAEVNHLKELSQKFNTKSIINHIIKFCDITGHHRQDLKDILTKNGFQVLNLERDYSQRMDGQLKTRIEAFLEMIE